MHIIRAPSLTLILAENGDSRPAFWARNSFRPISRVSRRKKNKTKIVLYYFVQALVFLSFFFSCVLFLFVCLAGVLRFIGLLFFRFARGGLYQSMQLVIVFSTFSSSSSISFRHSLTIVSYCLFSFLFLLDEKTPRLPSTLSPSSFFSFFYIQVLIIPINLLD